MTGRHDEESLFHVTRLHCNSGVRWVAVVCVYRDTGKPCTVTGVNDSKTDTIAARFAENVRARRQLLGKSQAELAQGMRDLGFESFRQQTVAEVEAGNRQVKLDEAHALARVLGQTMDGMTRPAGLARQANALLEAAGNLLDASREESRWASERDSAQRRVEKALSAADGWPYALSDEIAVARRALDRAGVGKRTTRRRGAGGDRSGS